VKILQIAPLWERVPPLAYGGTEAVVSVLCEELVRRGHEVRLVASGDSRTTAGLFSIYPRSLRTAEDLQAKLPYELIHAALALKDAPSFDIIHNHNAEMVMAMGHLVDAPMLTTMHNRITADTKFVWDHYNGWYNTISDAERAGMPAVANDHYVGTIYNAIDVDTFPYEEEKDDYLLFLSRISPDKAPHLAIEVAKRLGMRIIVAGKIDPNPIDEEYFRTQVAPLLDGKQVRFFGEATGIQKRALYARARCLVIPLCWEEPFGLVMAESMACGTPVVAFRRGAAEEVVAHGESGFLVEDLDAMVEAVRLVDQIDPRRCRRIVEERFAPESMADGYEKAYQQILATLSTRPLRTLPTVSVPLTSHPAAEDAIVA
jgi:glycosyltransferase involved in cell wall biosynthesis